MSFLIGLAAHSLLAWIAWMSQVSFSFYVGTMQVITFAYFATEFVLTPKPHWAGGTLTESGQAHAADRRRSADGTRKPSRAIALIALAIALAFAFKPPAFQYRGDEFDHIGYMRAIQYEDRMAPTGVLAPIGDNASNKADPRKGTLHPYLAAIADVAAVAPDGVWRYLPAFFAPAALLAFYGFAVALLPGTLYVAACMLLFLLFQGGIGTEFLGDVAYGQNLSLVFFWTLVPLAIQYGRRSVPAVLALAALLTAGGGLVHIEVLAHVSLLLVSLAFAGAAFGLSQRARWAFTGACGAAVLIVAAWKLATAYGAGNIVHTHAQGLLYFGDIGGRFFIPSPIEMLKRYGLLFIAGLAMVPGLIAIRGQRASAMRCLALAAPPILIACNPLVAPLVYERATYMLHRLLLNVPAFATTVLVLGALVGTARRGAWLKRIAALIAIFMWAKVAWVSGAAWASHSLPSREENDPLAVAVRGAAGYLQEHAPRGSVVASDPVTSYWLSSLADVKVIAVLDQHGDPLDSIPVERVRATADIVSPYTSIRATLAAIERFSVAYVVLNGAFPAPVSEYLAAYDPGSVPEVELKFHAIEERLTLVYVEMGVLIYEVRSDDREVGEYSWAPSGSGILDRPDASWSMCPERADAALVVSAVGLRPRAALPGEAVAVSLAYTRDGTPDSVLPLKLHVRLEDREYFDGARSFPGDKLLRRYRERQSGTFARVRVDHVPFNGLLPPDRWPLGHPVYETIEINAPRARHNVSYEVQVKLVHDPMLPNFSVRDLLFNDDSYGGTPCGVLDVRRQLNR